MTDITKTSLKNFCLGEGSCYKSLFFHLKRFETLLKPSISTAYLRPQDRHAHRTQGSTHAMSAEDQLIGLSFCVFFRWNQQTAGFTPRNWLVFGWFWLVFGWFFLMFLRPFPKMKRGSLGRLFSGRMKIHIPFDDFSQGILRKWA